MIAAPWYLLSFGVVLIIAGALPAGFLGGGTPSGLAIDPRMKDEEIARRLRRESSLTVPGVIVYAGLTCLLVSLAWRLLRYFL